MMTPQNLQFNPPWGQMADFKSWDWWLHFKPGITGVLLQQVSNCPHSIKLLAHSLCYCSQMTICETFPEKNIIYFNSYYKVSPYLVTDLLSAISEIS